MNREDIDRAFMDAASRARAACPWAFEVRFIVSGSPSGTRAFAVAMERGGSRRADHEAHEVHGITWRDAGAAALDIHMAGFLLPGQDASWVRGPLGPGVNRGLMR